MSFIGNYTLGDIMNAIHSEASPSYQERVPLLSDTNFTEFATGLSNPAIFNEWHSALINRIGRVVLQNKAWENPLAFLKKGEIPLGNTIQEIYVDLIDAVPWESESTEADAGKVWKTVKPDVFSAYHVINREDQYPISYNRAEINRAFVSASALEQFILGIIERLYTSDALDEFLYMKQLLVEYDKKGLFHYHTIPQDATMDELIVQVRSMSNKFTFLSDKYTGLGVTQHSNKNDQVILISSDLDARMDVMSLASAFNMDKKEFLARRIVLDEFPIEGALLALVDRDWFMVYDYLRELHPIFNPRTLEIKYYYTVHQYISTSLFQNAVLFTTQEYGKPQEVTASLVGATGGVEKAQSYLIEHEVLGGEAGSLTSDNTNQAVGYQLSGAVAGTRIDGGRLYVDLRQDTPFEIKVFALHQQDVYDIIEVDLAE